MNSGLSTHDYLVKLSLCVVQLLLSKYSFTQDQPLLNLSMASNNFNIKEPVLVSWLVLSPTQHKEGNVTWSFFQKNVGTFFLEEKKKQNTKTFIKDFQCYDRSLCKFFKWLIYPTFHILRYFCVEFV